VDAKLVTERALDALRADITAIPRLHVLAAGKAAVGMASAVDEKLGSRVARGVVTTLSAAVPRQYTIGPHWEAIDTTHPLPSTGSETAGLVALALADTAAAEGALLLVCLSGGASSMLAVPAQGLTIEDKAATGAVLLDAGLDIATLNLVRRHMSAIKGGRLASRARRTMTLAISDVSDTGVDEAEVIGSGPTIADRSTRGDARAVLVEHDLLRRLPPRVVAHFESRSDADRTAPHSAPPIDLTRETSFWIVASRSDAMQHASRAAARLGYLVDVVDTPLGGTAATAAAALLARASRLPRPACLVASGETTVRVRGSGRGGRNQELAVGALTHLGGIGTVALASINTDGIDGPTDAAGAFVDDSMWIRLGSEPQSRCADALARNDTYPLLDELDALVRTGPTGTNVGDLVVILLR
jgi:glycerate-2-kinase